MTKQLADTSDLSALSALAPELAATFVSIASDIALVVDSGGVIRNVALGEAGLATSAGAWVGRSWADTVTGETRQKIEQLLQEVRDGGVSRRREVNHPSAAGLDIPVAYAAIRLGEHGPVLAVGRDLRAIAAIQQRFAQTQQEMERGYWKLRQAESRYRKLFQVATDAVMVVDALTTNVVEANRAAAQLFNLTPEALVGKPASIGIDRNSRAAVEELLNTARATGRSAEIRARLVGGQATISVSATPFRGEDGLLLLMRARTIDLRPASSEASATLADFVERTPDAVVITDSSGRILMANPAFLGLCQLSSEAHVSGQPLNEWVGDGQHALAAVLSEVKSHGITGPRGAVVRGGQGRTVAVEMSAVLLDDGDQECLGFTLRQVTHRPADGLQTVDEFVAAVERLTGQLGRLPLTELIEQTVDLAERHLLKTALDRTAGDGHAAAALLGLGHDRLLDRLDRHGLQPSGSPTSRLLN